MQYVFQHIIFSQFPEYVVDLFAFLFLYGFSYVKMFFFSMSNALFEKSFLILTPFWITPTSNLLQINLAICKYLQLVLSAFWHWHQVQTKVKNIYCFTLKLLIMHDTEISPWFFWWEKLIPFLSFSPTLAITPYNTFRKGFIFVFNSVVGTQAYLKCDNCAH